MGRNGSRILILGISGIIGHKAWEIFRDRFDDVHGTVRRPKEHYDDIPLIRSSPQERITYGLDLHDPTDVLPVLERVRPTVVFNCTGLTYRRPESPSYEANVRINALLPHLLNEWCAKNKSRLIGLSTDCVFSGKAGDYTEESIPDARDAYGRSKAMGEVDYSPNAFVVRTSVIGREIENHTELLDWFLGHDGKSVKGFRRAIWSGLGTPFLVKTIADVIERHPKLAGLYQISGQPISKYDLLVKVREKFGVNVEIIPDDEKVARKNLIGEKFRAATGIVVPSIDVMLEDIKNGTH